MIECGRCHYLNTMGSTKCKCCKRDFTSDRADAHDLLMAISICLLPVVLGLLLALGGK